MTTRRLFLAGLLLAALAAAGRAEGPLKVCLLSGSEEYKSDDSLAAFATLLERDYGAQATLLMAQGTAELPGLEALDDSDVALFFTRRLTIEGEDLERVKKYCHDGRPVVGVRTASHGFQNWLAMDHDVLGGNYQGHFGNDQVMTATIKPNRQDHPVLKGVTGPIESKYSLYKTIPLSDDAQLLMTGQTAESGGAEPVTWVREHNQQRVFYTSLGGPEDFENPQFQRLLVNALYWAAGREPPAP